jgi:predicted anti-sigma-YlaC factor YlaD
MTYKEHSSNRLLTCARVRVLLEPYADEELHATDLNLATAVRDHLAGCADCRRQHHQVVSLPFRLRALSAPTPPQSLVNDVMGSIATTRGSYQRAWMLLAPEALLAAFILWYLSGLEGLASVASGIFTDLQSVAGWGAGTASLPSIPAVDVLFLIALIALTAIAAYHISVLIRLDPGPAQGTFRGRVANE